MEKSGKNDFNMPQRPEINGKAYWIISGMISIIGAAAVAFDPTAFYDTLLVPGIGSVLFNHRCLHLKNEIS